MRRTPSWVCLMAATVSIATILGGVTGCPDPAQPRHWTQVPYDQWWWQPADVSTVDDEASVYALDPFTASAQLVTELHLREKGAICHLRVGLWEPARPDADRFDPAVLGSSTDVRASLGGMPRWIDVRRWDALADVIEDRIALCAAKGFDGVALSAIDGYAHATGFPLTYADQLAFNNVLVALARQHGLVVGFVAAPLGVTADVVGSAGMRMTSGS